MPTYQISPRMAPCALIFFCLSSLLTPPSAKLFSRFMGILYIGFAVGPSIASVVLRQTVSKNLTPLFFMSACSYALSLFFILLVVPESLHSADKPRTEQGPAQTSNSEHNTSNSTILAPWRRFVAPVAAFRPRRVGALHKDYTLTIIAVSYFIYLMSLALYQLKYLYAEHGESNFCRLFSSIIYQTLFQCSRGMQSE